MAVVNGGRWCFMSVHSSLVGRSLFRSSTPRDCCCLGKPWGHHQASSWGSFAKIRKPSCWVFISWRQLVQLELHCFTKRFHTAGCLGNAGGQRKKLVWWGETEAKGNKKSRGCPTYWCNRTVSKLEDHQKVVSHIPGQWLQSIAELPSAVHWSPKDLFDTWHRAVQKIFQRKSSKVKISGPAGLNTGY